MYGDAGTPPNLRSATDRYGSSNAQFRTRKRANRGLVFELSERVRETIQEKLYENLVKRGAAFV